MTPDSIQKPLFNDPIGQRFKIAREKARYSKQSVAKQLRLPLVVIDALENEDWARLGAPIYVRSYIASYARLLGLPQEISDDVVYEKPLPTLMPITIRSSLTPRFLGRNTLSFASFNLASLATSVIILALAVLLAIHYYNSPKQITQTLPLDTLATTDPVMATSTSDGASGLASPMTQLPLLPPQSRPEEIASAELVLSFSADSWVDIVDDKGRRVEYGIVSAGSKRRYTVDRTFRVLLGDASAIQATLNGQNVDLAPYRAANTVRFTVSSAGQITSSNG